MWVGQRFVHLFCKVLQKNPKELLANPHYNLRFHYLETLVSPSDISQCHWEFSGILVVPFYFHISLNVSYSSSLYNQFYLPLWYSRHILILN